MTTKEATELFNSLPIDTRKTLSFFCIKQQIQDLMTEKAKRKKEYQSRQREINEHIKTLERWLGDMKVPEEFQIENLIIDARTD